MPIIYGVVTRSDAVFSFHCDAGFERKTLGQCADTSYGEEF